MTSKTSISPGLRLTLSIVSIWVFAFLVGNALTLDSPPLRFAIGIACACGLFKWLGRFSKATSDQVDTPHTSEKSDGSGDGQSPVASNSVELDRAYEVLQLHPNCTDEMLKAAHRHHVSQWHPDKLSNAPEELRKLATERLAVINAAHDLIAKYRKSEVHA